MYVCVKVCVKVCVNVNVCVCLCVNVCVCACVFEFLYAHNRQCAAYPGRVSLVVWTPQAPLYGHEGVSLRGRAVDERGHSVHAALDKVVLQLHDARRDQGV